MTDRQSASDVEPQVPDAPIRAVDFYWRPGCPFCMSLRHSLKRAGVAVRPLNIWEDEAAAAQVRVAANGSETVPTIAVGDDYLVNPSAGQVVAQIAKHDPDWAAELLGDQPAKRRWFGRGSA